MDSLVIRACKVRGNTEKRLFRIFEHIVSRLKRYLVDVQEAVRYATVAFLL